MRALPPPRDLAGRFVNWAGTVASTPSAWQEPDSLDAIARVVRAAVSRGQKLRVVGAGHSWSAIAAPVDGQVAMSLDRCAGIVSVQGTHAATVRGGTRLRDLSAALAARGLALPIVGSIHHQSIAGAIATGTHGSSLRHGNLASLVERLVLVDGRGERVELGAGDPRLAGARVHLGALGVVAELTLRVEPAFRLAEHIEAIPLTDVIGSLETIAHSAEYVKIWWLPHTTRAHVYRYQRTDEPASRRPSARTLRWIDEQLIHRHAFPAVVALEARHPASVPRWNRALARSFERGRRVGASDLMLNVPMPFRHRETEAAVPLAGGVADEALFRVARAIDAAHVHVNMPVELRFVRADDGWLSPASGRDTCQIGAYAGRLRDVDRFFAVFWRELRALGARPHWGKELDHSKDELRALYPRWDAFRELRAAFDPARVFASPFQERTLGD
jgi:FAD/FMN-containing dehydrogenase